MKKWISVMLLISMVMTLAIAGSPAASAEGSEAADLASNIARANIDTVIYLDYAAGINAGVYKWVLSEDGEYYALAAVDENGEPIKAQETAINVGANNAERGDRACAGRLRPCGRVHERQYHQSLQSDHGDLCTCRLYDDRHRRQCDRDRP